MTTPDELKAILLELTEILEGLESGTVAASQDVAKRVRALRDRYQGEKAVDRARASVEKSFALQEADRIERLEAASRDYLEKAARSPTQFSKFFSLGMNAAREAQRLRQEQDARDPDYQAEVEAFVEDVLRRRKVVRP